MTATSPRKVSPKKPTSPAQWKKGQSEPYELPSGNYMRIRRIGMQTLMATGKVPNQLLGTMKKAVDKGTGMAGVEEEMNSLIADEQALRELAEFMDNLLMMVSVEPKVHPTPDTEADRQDDLLYCDEVDEEDKSFIFQLVVGGTDDIATFREQSRAGLATVFGREDVELPTK